MFNIRNYSFEVINIVIPRVNNFDIKQKKAYNIYYMPTTPIKIWEDKS